LIYREFVRRREEGEHRRRKGKEEDNRKAGLCPPFCVIYHARVLFWGRNVFQVGIKAGSQAGLPYTIIE